MCLRIDLIYQGLNKVEMVDAWTQTSNHESDNENINNFKDIKIKEERSISVNKNIDLNSYPMSLDDSPLAYFK